MNDMIAHRKTKWDVTPEQEAELRGERWQGGRVIRRADWEQAMRDIEWMQQDADFRHRLLVVKERKATEEWYKAVSARRMRPV
jgi:hypothetical protein